MINKHTPGFVIGVLALALVYHIYLVHTITSKTNLHEKALNNAAVLLTQHEQFLRPIINQAQAK